MVAAGFIWDIVEFQEFFVLFVPSVVTWLIPAVIMRLTVPNTAAEQVTARGALRQGAWIVVGLLLLTIAMAVSSHT